MDIQKATEEKLERAIQMGVPIDEAILEGLIQKNYLLKMHLSVYLLKKIIKIKKSEKMSFQFVFQMML